MSLMSLSTSVAKEDNAEPVAANVAAERSAFAALTLLFRAVV